MTFRPAVEEQRFVLENVARISAVTDVSLVDAILEGVGQFALGEWAPLNRQGDLIGAQLTTLGVEMPEGFEKAYRAYVSSGWGTIAVPEEHGGQGLPFVIQSAILETLGTANMSLALCPTLTVGAVEALLRHGTEDQKRNYLPKLVTGEWTGTMNLTEPQAGSDVGALQTKATPLPSGQWSITGTKIYISFGDHDMAENIVHLVLARTPDAPEGTRGISLFLVPKYRLDPAGAPGEPNDIRVVSLEHKMGLHASPTCVLAFGDRGECIGDLIGTIGGGMRAMFTMMNSARLNVGLQGVQVAEAATQRAARYAVERVQSPRTGSPSRQSVAIVEHPDVRRMLLRMKAQTQAARALVYYAASMVDRADTDKPEASDRLQLLTPLAKAHATDIGCEVSSIGIQVHGGMGYVEETGAAQLVRDARIAPIYEGTNGIQAADLVNRKLGLNNGAVFLHLIDEMRAEATAETLIELIDDCQTLGQKLLGSSPDDRLGASYPFLSMLATAVCGWLMERQTRVSGDGEFAEAKRIIGKFYLEQIVPEALGLRAAAASSSTILYALTPRQLSV